MTTDAARLSAARCLLVFAGSRRQNDKAKPIFRARHRPRGRQENLPLSGLHLLFVPVSSISYRELAFALSFLRAAPPAPPCSPSRALRIGFAFSFGKSTSRENAKPRGRKRTP